MLNLKNLEKVVAGDKIKISHFESDDFIMAET
jgi:hypothetical protein